MAFDLEKLITKLQKDLSKTPILSDTIGLGNSLPELNKETDFIQMPDWWKKGTNTPGLAYGRITQIAGISDSGKTSAAIEAIKAAQAQGSLCIYVETENKTTTTDLIKWGVDLKKVVIIKVPIAEQLYELLFKTWDAIHEATPETPLLVVIDSLGNVMSQRDSELDMLESSSKPGGKGQVNRLGIEKMILRARKSKVAILLINYTYDNMGSPGKTNAGGQALQYHSSLIYQTARRKWLEKTVKGEKVRIGAEVVWKLNKNHLFKDDPGPKEMVLHITADGISLVGENNETEE